MLRLKEMGEMKVTGQRAHLKKMITPIHLGQKVMPLHSFMGSSGSVELQAGMARTAVETAPHPHPL